MMGFIRVAVAVLGLLSVGQSAPVTSCESLIQPLEIKGRDQLLGKWTQVAESTDLPYAELMKKTFLESTWIKITAANESDAVRLMGTSKMFGFCLSATIKMTLERNTLQAVVNNMTLTEGPFLTVSLLKTSCPDCLLVKAQHISAGGIQSLCLLSKRKTVTSAELDELKKQADCLNLLRPFTPKLEGDVCPEPPSLEIDEPHFLLNGQSMEFTQAAEKITNHFGGPENFVKMVSEVLSKQ